MIHSGVDHIAIMVFHEPEELKGLIDIRSDKLGFYFSYNHISNDIFFHCRFPEDSVEYKSIHRKAMKICESVIELYELPYIIPSKIAHSAKISSN